MKIAAAYIRVSTNDQTEYSPDSQLKVIQDHAKRDDYVIPVEYIFQDDGISGKAADKRPAFREMIALAKSDDPPFEAIFVWEYSRFARNQEESILYKNLLKKNGVTVKSVREPITDSPFGSLIERIIEWMDEYYLINLAHEVRRGMTEKAHRGEAMGTAPFGYTCKNKTFVPNENAPIIEWVFEQYVAGKGARVIATELNAMGVKTRRGNPIDNRWVIYVVSNPVYIGKIRWSTEGHANYSRTNYNGEKVIISDGNHQPIVGMELWEKAQEKLSQRKLYKYKRQEAKKFMLKGLCRCSSCGATLTLNQQNFLQCHRYAKGQCFVSHCLKIDTANETVIQRLESFLENKSFRVSPQKPVRNAPRREWDKLIAAEEERLRRAKNALLDGAFTNDEYKAVKAEIEDAISRLMKGKESGKPKEPNVEQMQERVCRVLDVIKSTDVSEEDKNVALRTIIDKIVYVKQQKTLEIYFLP